MIQEIVTLAHYAIFSVPNSSAISSERNERAGKRDLQKTLHKIITEDEFMDSESSADAPPFAVIIMEIHSNRY